MPSGLRAIGLCFALSIVQSFILAVSYNIPTASYEGRAIWLGFLSVNITAFVVYRLVLYPKYFTVFRKLPAPDGSHFLLGHGTLRTERNKGERSRQWIDQFPSDDLIYVKDFFGADALLPTVPDLLMTVLVDKAYDYQKDASIQNILRGILGDGLILVEGGAHKFQRRHLLPSFQLKTIRGLYPVFWAKACELVNCLSSELNNARELEMSAWSTRVTLDIIGVAAFGKDFGTLKNPDTHLVNQYHLLLEPTGAMRLWFALNFMIPRYVLDWIPFWDAPKVISSISSSLKSYAMQLVHDRKTLLSKADLTAPNTTDFKDLLSLLVLSNDFTDVELADQVLTMLAAGHETTSSTLSWALYLLATHPDIQERLRNEVRGALPSPTDNLIDSNIIDALPLLHAVCNETLRLYPTVPFDARTVVKPTKLGNHLLPKDTVVFLPPWSYNRCEKFWGKEAALFRPERWINENGIPNNNGGATSNYMLMTFLHGPRSCIGQGFAKSELKCLLAALVGAFNFSLSRDSDTYVPAGLVTTKPEHGMWLNVQNIPGW